VGGWKYINDKTGVLFDGADDFLPAVQRLRALKDAGKLQPREWFRRAPDSPPHPTQQLLRTHPCLPVIFNGCLISHPLPSHPFLTTSSHPIYPMLSCLFPDVPTQSHCLDALASHPTRFRAVQAHPITSFPSSLSLFLAIRLYPMP
jgi:hypothetical protein